jgi:hypothetical protein
MTHSLSLRLRARGARPVAWLRTHSEEVSVRELGGCRAPRDLPRDLGRARRYGRLGGPRHRIRPRLRSDNHPSRADHPNANRLKGTVTIPAVSSYFRFSPSGTSIEQ